MKKPGKFELLKLFELFGLQRVSMASSGTSTKLLSGGKVHIEVKEQPTDYEGYDVLITPIWPLLGLGHTDIVLSLGLQQIVIKSMVIASGGKLLKTYCRSSICVTARV